MQRRYLIQLFATVLAVGSIALHAAAQSEVRNSGRPNVVLILMDDIGYSDIGSYGVKDAKTPNLDKIAKQSVKLARGNIGMIPVIFFFLAATLASIGAGNIATTALLAPVAMAVAGNMGISAFLMTVAVCCGANSGALSPFAPTRGTNSCRAYCAARRDHRLELCLETYRRGVL